MASPRPNQIEKQRQEYLAREKARLETKKIALAATLDIIHTKLSKIEIEIKELFSTRDAIYSAITDPFSKIDIIAISENYQAILEKLLQHKEIQEITELQNHIQNLIGLLISVPRNISDNNTNWKLFAQFVDEFHQFNSFAIDQDGSVIKPQKECNQENIATTSSAATSKQSHVISSNDVAQTTAANPSHVIHSNDLAEPASSTDITTYQPNGDIQSLPADIFSNIANWLSLSDIRKFRWVIGGATLFHGITGRNTFFGSTTREIKPYNPQINDALEKKIKEKDHEFDYLVSNFQYSSDYCFIFAVNKSGKIFYAYESEIMTMKQCASDINKLTENINNLETNTSQNQQSKNNNLIKDKEKLAELKQQLEDTKKVIWRLLPSPAKDFPKCYPSAAELFSITKAGNLYSLSLKKLREMYYSEVYDPASANWKKINLSFSFHADRMRMIKKTTASSIELTQFCLFVIDDKKNQIFAKGVNNCGELGIGILRKNNLRRKGGLPDDYSPENDITSWEKVLLPPDFLIHDITGGEGSINYFIGKNQIYVSGRLVFCENERDLIRDAVINPTPVLLNANYDYQPNVDLFVGKNNYIYTTHENAEISVVIANKQIKVRPEYIIQLPKDFTIGQMICFANATFFIDRSGSQVFVHDSKEHFPAPVSTECVEVRLPKGFITRNIFCYNRFISSDETYYFINPSNQIVTIKTTKVFSSITDYETLNYTCQFPIDNLQKKFILCDEVIYFINNHNHIKQIDLHSKAAEVFSLTDDTHHPSKDDHSSANEITPKQTNCSMM